MKHIFRKLFLPSLLFLSSLFVPVLSCSDADNQILGAIMFTSNVNCSFRLFDGNGRQLANDVYELDRPPTVVNMRSSGIFIIQAESAGKEIKEPIVYQSGTLEYCIEF